MISKTIGIVKCLATLYGTILPIEISFTADKYDFSHLLKVLSDNSFDNLITFANNRNYFDSLLNMNKVLKWYNGWKVIQ